MDKKRHKNKILLVLDTIFSIAGVGFLITYVLLYNFITPYPERYFLNEMTPDMIAQGQDINLIILVCFAFISIFFIILMIITNLIVLYYYFAKKSYFFKERIISNNFKLSIKYLLTILFIVIYIYIFASIFFVWYFWLVFAKEYENKFKNNSFIMKVNKLYTDRICMISLFFVTIISMPIILISSFMIYFSLPYKYVSKLPKENIKEYLKVSKNHENVFVFYFDRSTAFFWNTLLLADFYLNKNKSFISMFPEFTSYSNTLTLSNITRIANPPMWGGYYNQAWAKNYLHPDWTEDNLWLNSFYSITKMANKYNFTCKINNSPYYGETYNTACEMDKLQYDLRNNGVDVVTMNNATLVLNGYNYSMKRYEKFEKCELIALDQIDEHYNFVDTEKGVFNLFFSQSTHVPYVYMKNDKYYVNLSSDYYISSMWSVIQSLKKILNKFKFEGVYNKTMFLIISDHGLSLEGNWKYSKGMFDWLLEKNIINTKWHNKMYNWKFYQYNPVIMIKNFNENKKDIREFFNYNKTLTLADIPYIIENSINKMIGHNSYESSFIQNVSGDENKINFINDEIVFDPLNSNTNNREFIISSVRGWGYDANNTNIPLSWIYKWKQIDNSFWSENNYTLIKK